MAEVLVIEDDDRIRRSLMLALEDEGHVVRGVATAEDGLREHRDSPADAVLVDLMLPGLDGFECVRQLRRDGDVSIVVVSARDDTHDVVAALEAGADDYVVKEAGRGEGALGPPASGQAPQQGWRRCRTDDGLWRP